MRRRINCVVIALLLPLALSICTLTACSEEQPGKETQNQSSETMKAIQATAAATDKEPENLINPEGNTVEERIKVPAGFARVEASEDSFAQYLRNLPLKPDGSEVRLYNGNSLTSNHHSAVLDIDVGSRDLQQCADSVMRLWAEYLYGRKDFDKIHFNFTNGFNANFSKWMGGNSIKVEGNEVRWIANSTSTAEYSSFRKYLDMVYSYAGTLSLAKEMVETPLEEMQPGDVFIEGGSPGHAVIVIDMAINEKTGEKIFIIAQGYMPAQEMHILRNPDNDELSPWYSYRIDKELDTPQWKFDKNSLKRFKN